MTAENEVNTEGEQDIQFETNKLHEINRERNTGNDINYKDIRQGDVLRFIRADAETETFGKVITRAGKVGGKNESFFFSFYGNCPK